MISLHEPQFDEADERYVLEALRSSWVSTGGPFVDRFERGVAAFVGARHAVSTSNGTVALTLMIDALARLSGVTTPFEVLIPTMSFIATANSVVHAGGRPVFLDTAPGSLHVSPDQLQACLSEHYFRDDRANVWRSRVSELPLLAYLHASLMGWSGDTASFKSLCEAKALPLLVDAAESLGSRAADGLHLGREGLAAVFSFNGNKILTTGGGGMIVTDDDVLARSVKHLSTTARTDEVRFVHDEVGYNFRLVNLLAALGCSQLDKLPVRLVRKRQIFELYKKLLAKAAPRVTVYEEALSHPNHWLVNLVFATQALRERAMIRLLENRVNARPLWTPFHRQPALTGFLQPITGFPNADGAWQTFLSVPSSPQLPDDAIERICAVVIQSCAD